MKEALPRADDVGKVEGKALGALVGAIGIGVGAAVEGALVIGSSVGVADTVGVA